MQQFLGGVIALGLIACNSKTGSNPSAGSAASAGPAEHTARNPATGSDPGIDLNCVLSRLREPREAFHYVYKKDAGASDHVDQEADVTPQTVDGFRLQPDGSKKPLHAEHSDSQSWQAALAGLTGISGMAGTLAVVNHNSAMKRESDGVPLNGYDTIHYSIDTARFDATERKMLLDPGDSEKGDAWVTSEGCPVKIVLDSELHNKDGSLIEKIHYEESMAKK
jgi:hypothetical protein